MSDKECSDAVDVEKNLEKWKTMLNDVSEEIFQNTERREVTYSEADIDKAIDNCFIYCGPDTRKILRKHFGRSRE